MHAPSLVYLLFFQLKPLMHNLRLRRSIASSRRHNAKLHLGLNVDLSRSLSFDDSRGHLSIGEDSLFGNDSSHAHVLQNKAVISPRLTCSNGAMDEANVFEASQEVGV